MVYLIISACSSKKDDAIPVSMDVKTLTPFNYLDNPSLANQIIATRDKILHDPRARAGRRETLAFDLYFRAGKAYSKIFSCYYLRLKSLVLENSRISWFFLSGGYGIVHALERTVKYQATFSKKIAEKYDIPYTTPIWENILPEACNAIMSKIDPEYVYAFGSRDYTRFVKLTERWKSGDKIKIFEGGLDWVSCVIYDLVTAIMEENLETFNHKYPHDFVSPNSIAGKTRGFITC